MKIFVFCLRCFVLVALPAAFSFTLSAQMTTPSSSSYPEATAAEAEPVIVNPPKSGAVASTNRWGQSIVDFEKSDAATPPPRKGVLFVGSSTLRLWSTLPKDFPEIPVINRGFGGAQMSDVLQYTDRIVIPYDPLVVVVFCGGNDLTMKKTPDQVLETYKAFEAKVHAALPETIIIFITSNATIKGMALAPLIRELNAKTKEFVATKPRTLQIDSYSKMIGPDGQPQEKFFRDDKAHPSAEGFSTFLATIKPEIIRAYKEAGGTTK